MFAKSHMMNLPSVSSGGCSGWTRGVSSHQKWWFCSGVGHIQGPRTVPPSDLMMHLPSVLSSIWPPKGGLQWLDSQGRFASKWWFCFGAGHIQGPRSVSPKSHMMHVPSVLSSIWLPKGGLQWLHSRGRFASKLVVLLGSGTHSGTQKCVC